MAGQSGDGDRKGRSPDASSSGRQIEVVELDDDALESPPTPGARPAPPAPNRRSAPPPAPASSGSRRSVPPPPPAAGGPRRSVPPPSRKSVPPLPSHGAPAQTPAAVRDAVTLPIGSPAPTRVAPPPPATPKNLAPAMGVPAVPAPGKPAVTHHGVPPPAPPKTASRPQMPAVRPPPKSAARTSSPPPPLPPSGAATPPATATTPAPTARATESAREEVPWHALFERLGREADALAATQAPRAALLLSALARAAVDVRGDVVVAESALNRAASLAPDARHVAMSRRWIAERRGKPSDVLPFARAELPLASEPRERVALLFEIAGIEEHALNQFDSAERSLREASALDPQDLAAWEALAGLYLRRKDWRGAVAAWESFASITDDARIRAALHTAAANLREMYLDDVAGAQTNLRHALESDPTHVGAQAALEPILLRGKDWIEYARNVVVQGDQVGDAATARECYERAGDVLWECANDGASAAACYERAAAMAPREVSPLEKFAAVLEGSGRYADLPRVYERLLQVIREPLLQAAVLLKLGTLYESRLDRPDDAIRAYRRALEISPTFVPATQSLAALFRQRGMWPELIALELADAERIAHPGHRAARLCDVAELYDAELGKIEEAVTLYERVFALDPGNTAALDALDRIYRINGRWADLITLFERLVTHTKDPRRLRAVQLELAALVHERGGQPERAAQLFQKTLGVEQDAFPTLVALARAHADAGKWAEHVDVLEQQVRMLRDDDDVVRTLFRIASVIDARLGDTRRALLVYGRLLEKDPKHTLALQAISLLHQAQGRWDELITNERKLLALAPRPEDAATILYRVGRIAEERLGRVDDAVAAYEESLSKVPAFAPSLVAAERALRAAGKWQKLAELFEKQAGAVKDASAKARLLCQTASVQELHLGDGPKAVATFERALALVPDIDVAMWGCARIRESRGEWPAYEAALQALLKKTTHSGARLRLLARLGRLHEYRLASPAKASAFYEEALGVGTQAGAFAVDRLRVARAEGKRDVVSLWLAQIAGSTRDPRVALAFLRLRALAVEFGGGSAGDAVDAYAAALASQPTDALALEGLARSLARSTPDARLPQAIRNRALAMGDLPSRIVLLFIAAALLEHANRPTDAETIYSEVQHASPEFLPAWAGQRRIREAAGDVGAVAQIAARAGQIAAHSTNAADALLEAADLYVERLGNPREALGLYRAVLQQQPGNGRAFNRAMPLLEAAQDWKTAIAVLGAHADAVSDDSVRAKMLASRAQILAERLGDTKTAIADLERALSIRSDEPALLGMLARLHEREQHWQDAALLYGRLSRTISEGALRREAALAEARIWMHHVRDFERARGILQDLVRADSSDRAAAMRLAEVHSLLGDFSSARDLYQQLAASGPGAERARSLLALAEVNRTGLNDLPASHAAGAAVFQIATQDPAIVPLLEEHYARTEDWGAFATLGDEVLPRVQPTSPGVLALRMALARVYREKLRAIEPADQHLRAAIDAFPNATEARIALGYGLLGGNDHAAVSEFRRVIDIDPVAPAAYRGLMLVCQRMGLAGAASLMASAVSLLGESGPQVEGALTLAVHTPPIANSLGPEEALQHLVGATRARFVRRVLTLLDPHLHEIFPAQTESLAGLSRLPESFPAVGAARAVASALSVGSLALYRGNTREATLVLSDPRAMVLGADHLAENRTARVIFDVAATCSRIAAASALGQVFPLDQVFALLEVATDPNADAPGYRELRKRVSSALPRRARKEIERLVEEAPGELRRETPAWDEEERRRAMRVGVVFSRDMRVAAQALAPDAAGQPNIEERRRALAANGAIVEALRFAASEACWAAQRRVFGQA